MPEDAKLFILNGIGRNVGGCFKCHPAEFCCAEFIYKYGGGAFQVCFPALCLKTAGFAYGGKYFVILCVIGKIYAVSFF